MSAEDAIQAARGFVAAKAKWRHMGRKPWAMDCLGLVQLAMQAGGYTLRGIPEVYGREPWDDMLRKGLRAEFGEPVDDWKPGDVPLIRWGKAKPSHVGILADYWMGGLSIIHCSNRICAIETRLAEAIRDCVVEVYRPDWGRT